MYHMLMLMEDKEITEINYMYCEYGCVMKSMCGSGRSTCIMHTQLKKKPLCVVGSYIFHWCFLFRSFVVAFFFLHHLSIFLLFRIFCSCINAFVLKNIIHFCPFLDALFPHSLPFVECFMPHITLNRLYRWHHRSGAFSASSEHISVKLR